MKRIIGATLFRSILVGGVVTGLCFLAPSFMPFFIGAGAILVGGSVAYSVHKSKKIDDYYHSIPFGDLELYEEPEQSLYSKIETKVLDGFEAITDLSAIKEKFSKKKSIKSKLKQEVVENIEHQEEVVDLDAKTISEEPELER